jgi:hypothetical protein
MFAWPSLLRLLAGWGLLLAGVLVLLDSNMPRSPGRDKTWLALQALAGFALAAGGWRLRRRALRPPGNPK